jgi:hypothetical protein
VELDYADCGIANIAALDLIASVRLTRSERPPTPLDQDRIRVEIQGWIFPRSGV